LLRPAARELLELADHRAAAVVAAARITLRLLVRRHRADGLEHGGPREVLGGDQLDLAALALELLADEPRDLGVERVETRLLQLLERRLGRGHTGMLLGEGAGALPQDTRRPAGE